MKYFSFKLEFGSQKVWISPVLKQCYVTLGVTLNMAAIGLVLGFAVALLDQLKAPGSPIPINDEQGSWIASIPGFFTFAGSFLVVPIMGKYGRRTANLISIILLIIAWIGVIVARSFAVLLVARALQGVNMGMSTTLGSLLIGEYTSPKNRGAFLMTIAFALAAAVLCAHVIAAFMTWRIGALVFTITAFIDLVIVFLSPESPSWLASQGRYDECKRVFRWLRGDTEEDELDKMIDACVLLRNSKQEEDASETMVTKIGKNVAYIKEAFTKKEFYKPLIIVGHVYALAVWCGLNVIVAYPEAYIRKISGEDVNVPLITTSLDAQRIVSCVLATFIIKKVKRRIMLLVTTIINVIALLTIAAYVYAKENYTLPFDHPMIGVILTHCMMFAIATGTLPLPYTIAGEIFPLKYKTIAGGIGTLIFSFHVFVVFKTIPVSFANIGIYGTFGIYALILTYCMSVTWVLLPETKDRTLQDIEDEFRGNPTSEESEPDFSSIERYRSTSINN